MTWFNEDAQKEYAGNHTRARQRWENLKRDCRQTMEMGEFYIIVLWPMSGWQIWKRVDKVWVEYQLDCADMTEAIKKVQELQSGR